ncbi:MAG: tetratricopeptide repeat protein [Candidatus Scalindua sp.]
MSIIDDALKKTQANLAKRKEKDFSKTYEKFHGHQDYQENTVSGQIRVKTIWYKNVYVLTCIFFAVGALLYTVLDFSGQPDLPIKPKSPDRKVLPVQPKLPDHFSLPAQKKVVPPEPDQPKLVTTDKTEVTEQYTKGLNYYKQGNYKEAIKWYRKAAEQGHAEAQNSLGIMYIKEQGVEQDYKEAVKWCRKAAKQEYLQAQYNLGIMYSKGLGTEQNYNKAVKWYRKAAERGYAQSQTILGLMYSKGQGVEQDYKEAVKWYRKAAKQGYVKAQFNLGVMYSEGHGVEQNNKEAVKWYRKAAE